MTAVLIASAVALGAFTQRITGVGFALVASPLMMLVIGPVQGVVVANLFGAVTAALLFALHVREVEYRRVLPILAAAFVAVGIGAAVARRLPPAVLSVVAGGLIILAIALSVFARRIPRVGAWPGQMVAGGLSGFMNVLAGAGGPPLSAYAIAARWDHHRFATSVQFCFMLLGAASLLARGAVPLLPIGELIVATAAMALGLTVGTLLRGRIPAGAARVGGVVLALGGGLGVLVRGVIELSAPS